jgi:transposase
MTLSIDLRERVVEAYLNGEGGYGRLAKRFSISPISVCRWVKRKAQTGTIEPFTSPGRPPIIARSRYDELNSFVKQHSDKTLEELCCVWQTHSGQVISQTKLTPIVRTTKQRFVRSALSVC